MELDILPSQERRIIERIEENTSRDDRKRKESTSVNPVLFYNEKVFHSAHKEPLSHDRNSGKETTYDKRVPKRREK